MKEGLPLVLQLFLRVARRSWWNTWPTWNRRRSWICRLPKKSFELSLIQYCIYNGYNPCAIDTPKPNECL